VRVCRISNRFPVHGLRVKSLQVCETMEGVLGLVQRSCSHRQGAAGSYDSQVNSAHVSRKGDVIPDSTSGGTDSDSGVPAGDDENVRGRHDTVKALHGAKRPQRVRILDAEKASVQWCAGS
jgi:hypothetical protein